VNCSSNECDVLANLQCINDSVSNVTGGGGWWYVLKYRQIQSKITNIFFSNCTSLQWWNGSYCRDKGTPAWGSNASAICNATYQCADYNFVSCPLGATCECATTKYWVC
jgi:hypothetical protein